jgi:hypothetical protein
MSDVSRGPGWWLASDGQWYPPHLPLATPSPLKPLPPRGPLIIPATHPAQPQGHPQPRARADAGATTTSGVPSAPAIPQIRDVWPISEKKPAITRPLLWAPVAVVLVVLIVVVATNGGKKSGGSAPLKTTSHISTRGLIAPTSVQSATAHTENPDSTTDSPVVWAAEHEDLLKELEADFTQFSSAADSEDLGATQAACRHLSNDVVLAQATEPIPVATDEQAWATALQESSMGSGECIDAIQQQDAALITQAEADIVSGNAQVVALINAITGPSAPAGNSGTSNHSVTSGNTGDSGATGTTGDSGNTGDSG